MDPISDTQFKLLQQRFNETYKDIFQNKLAEKTVVIIPSLTLDAEMLNTIKGSVHYEERLLCMLMLSRMRLMSRGLFKIFSVNEICEAS